MKVGVFGGAEYGAMRQTSYSTSWSRRDTPREYYRAIRFGSLIGLNNKLSLLASVKERTERTNGLTSAAAGEVLGGELVVVGWGTTGLTHGLADQTGHIGGRSNHGDGRNRSPDTKALI